MHLLSSLSLAAGLSQVARAGYSVADDYMSDFFNQFDFFTGNDPTNGYVNYVDSSTASNAGYIKQNDDNSIYIGVDYNNVASGRGRDSVRISTKKTYNHMLTVVDIGHMPGGICGTWPAFWSFGSGGSGWPSQGEIDIVEGANDQSQNYMSLHSSPGCSISQSTQSKVQSASQNCDANVNGNIGCSFHDDSTDKSYGSGFNSNGGGVYATEWNSNGVNIWFFPRGSEPSDVLGDSPNPSNWGEPSARFAGDSCDWDDKFKDHNLIFDTTFCGDWGRNTFDSCSAANGGQTCEQFVQNNPSAFKDAYWQVKALKVYQDNGQGSDSPTSSPSPETSYESVTSAVATPTSNLVDQVPTTLAVSATPTFIGVGASGQVGVPVAETPAATPVAQQPTTTNAPLGLDANGAVGGVFRENPSIAGSAAAPVASAGSPAPVASPIVPVSSPEVVDESPSGVVYDPAPLPGQTTSDIDEVEVDASGKVYDEVGKGKRTVSMRIAGRRLEHLRRHGIHDGSKPKPKHMH